jgi:hypothetical protein
MRDCILWTCSNGRLILSLLLEAFTLPSTNANTSKSVLDDTRIVHKHSYLPNLDVTSVLLCFWNDKR